MLQVFPGPLRPTNNTKEDKVIPLSFPSISSLFSCHQVCGQLRELGWLQVNAPSVWAGAPPAETVQTGGQTGPSILLHINPLTPLPSKTNPTKRAQIPSLSVTRSRFPLVRLLSLPSSTVVIFFHFSLPLTSISKSVSSLVQRHLLVSYISSHFLSNHNTFLPLNTLKQHFLHLFSKSAVIYTTSVL